MAQTYYSRPVSYGRSSLYRDNYNMSSNYSSNKKYNGVQSSGYGRSSPGSRSRSYSSDRISSGSSRVSAMVNDYTSKYPSTSSKYMNGGSSTYSRSNYGTSTSNYGTTSSNYGANLSSRPPSGRKLPQGPGPFDERGRKMDVSEAISQARRSRKSDGNGPVRATYQPSSYNDTDLARDTDRLSLADRSRDPDRFSDGSLIRSRKYGSTSSLKSTSTDRMSLHEDTYPLSTTSKKYNNTHTTHINLNKRDPLPYISTDTHSYRSTNGHIEDSDDRNQNDKYTCRRKNNTRNDNDDDSWSYHRNSPDGATTSSKGNDLEHTTVKLGQNHNQGLAGLSNLGNTCFMNTMIQCLSNIRPILEYFTSGNYKQELNRSFSKMHGDLAESFASLLTDIWTTSKRSSGYYGSSVRPTRFKQLVGQLNSRFRNTDQHDAQEFLILFLEGLSADVNRVDTKRKKVALEDKWDKASASEKAAATWRWYLSYENSYLMDQFVGQMKSTLTCSQCHGESHTFDCFWDISLPVRRSYSRGAVKLEDCMKTFFQKETLNGVHCDRCKSHVTCEKDLSVWRCPRILIVQLKRFEHSGMKVNTNVDYPVKDLDLSGYVANTEGGNHPVYNLIGVACHSGTPSFGHYIAYAKHPYSGTWHKYDDTSVTEATSRSYVTSSAYVLFYERSDMSSRL